MSAAQKVAVSDWTACPILFLSACFRKASCRDWPRSPNPGAFSKCGRPARGFVRSLDVFHDRSESGQPWNFRLYRSGQG